MDIIKKKITVVLGLILLFGIVLVYSSSYILSREYFNNSAYLAFKQIIFIITGIFACFLIAQTRLSFWFKYALPLHFATGVLLVFTLWGPFSYSMKGAKRWIHFSFIHFQPGEFVKLTCILASFIFFDNFFNWPMRERIKNTMMYFFPLFLILLQPDFGTFSICLVISIVSCYLSQFKRNYFYGLSFLAIILSSFIAVSAPYRMKRLLSYLDPWKDPQNSGFQVIQSFLAFAHGKFFGQGLGNSNEKLFYLPEAYNDFIFSVAGEELGFLGVTVIIFLFILFLYFGFTLASMIENRLSKMCVTLVFFSIGIQTILNMGVVLGLLPTKGLNLPFVSYGGSSLITNFFLLGLAFAATNSKSLVPLLNPPKPH